MKDLETFIDEVSAMLDNKSLLEMYTTATTEPDSFLYVKNNCKIKDEMIYHNFNQRLIIQMNQELLIIIHSYIFICDKFYFYKQTT